MAGLTKGYRMYIQVKSSTQWLIFKSKIDLRADIKKRLNHLETTARKNKELRFIADELDFINTAFEELSRRMPRRQPKK